MKRIVKAYSKPRFGAEYCYDLKEALLDAGVSEHDMLEHFFDYLTSDESIEVLKDFARMLDIDIEEIL